MSFFNAPSYNKWQLYPMARPVPEVLAKWHAICEKVEDYYGVTDIKEARAMRISLMSKWFEARIHSKDWQREPRVTTRDHKQDGHDLGMFLGTFRKQRDDATLADFWSQVEVMAGKLPYTVGRGFEYMAMDMLKRIEPTVFRCACCHAPSAAGHEYPMYGQADTYFCPSCVDSGDVLYLDIEEGWMTRSSSVVYRDYPDYEANLDDYDDHFVSTNYVHQHNLYWNDNLDVYITRATSIAISQSGPVDTTIYDYHGGPLLGHVTSAYDARHPCIHLGMELELEVPGADDGDDCISDIAHDIISAANAQDRRYMKAEHDGSLDAGFELITGWTGLDVHERNLKRITDLRVWKELRSHDTSTCGLHVHVDRVNMTPLHVVKLQSFINDVQNHDLIRCIARRYDTNYAKVHNGRNWLKEMPEILMVSARNAASWKGLSKSEAMKRHVDCGSKVQEIQSDRYSALNWTNKNTVEFRFFRGSTKLTTIMACLEFTFAVWHFTRLTPLTRLTTEAFIEFICAAENRKDTRYLRSYLHQRKFVRFYSYEQQMRPKDKRFKDPVTIADQTARDGREEVITLQELGESFAAMGRVAAS